MPKSSPKAMQAVKGKIMRMEPEIKNAYLIAKRISSGFLRFVMIPGRQ
jgi:hypothetical protein